MTDPASPPPLPETDVDGLRRLLEVSRRINAEAHADGVLKAIVDSLVSVTRADRGFLMLRAPDGELQFAIARDKKGHDLEEKKFQVSFGVVNEVARSGETKLIDDAAASDAYQARMSIISLSLRTILCVPLKTTAGVAGVIYVDSNAITRRFTEGDVPLVEAFATLAASALERLRLQEAEIAQERMRRQLEIAAEIQRTFLPAVFPTLPGVAGAVASVPALEVGGDFFDVIPLPGGRVGCAVGDVSGKGVPGALFGARLMSDVRYAALFHDDVQSTLEAVNAIVASRATRGMFVTFIYVVVDPETREVECGNAGHLPPLVRRADGTIDTWITPDGIPLGVLPEAAYRTGTRRLEEGETLVLLSDGIADAVGADGERFEDERVHATVSDGPAAPGSLVEGLLAATAAFTGNQPQADDQTLMAIAIP